MRFKKKRKFSIFLPDISGINPFSASKIDRIKWPKTNKINKKTNKREKKKQKKLTKNVMTRVIKADHQTLIKKIKTKQNLGRKIYLINPIVSSREKRDSQKTTPFNVEEEEETEHNYGRSRFSPLP